jgi:hypothetical protein
MSHTIVSPSLATTLRRWAVRTWDDPETRSTLIGLAGVLLIHLLLWGVVPHLLQFDSVKVGVRPAAKGHDFNIELAPETFNKAPVKPKDPFKFVETNPEAPENTPDRTNNFAAQNQQVAQEKPTPDGKSDRPATEGKKDFESTAIVSGRLTKPIEHMEAVPPPVEAPPQEQIVASARAEQNPLPGTEKVEGENKDGVGSSLAKRLENARAVPERIEGVKEGKETEGQAVTQQAIDPRRPQPRPQLVKTVQARPAILSENKFGTPNLGVIARDAKWSNYGAYLERVITTVQLQWERIIIEQKANPVLGSLVAVKFVMNDEGRIIDIGVVETSANDTATRACVSAITDRMPYGPWTDDMKAVLGNKQEMTFTFYYQ